jgi:hypothetical protein
MVMKPDMVFSREDYENKLTREQKMALYKFKEKGQRKGSKPNTSSVQQGGKSSAVTTPNTQNRKVHFAEQDRNESSSDEQEKSEAQKDEETESPIRKILSNHLNCREKQTQESSMPEEINFGGQTYRICKTHITYRVNNYTSTKNHTGALIDSGANSGVSGNYCIILEEVISATADVEGVGNGEMRGLKICQVASLIETDRGPIIGIFNQYAHFGKGQTIHSANQLRHFGVEVDETPKKTGGKQSIFHPDGYHIPLHIRNGLAYMDMYKPSQDELDKYPHVFFTSDNTWNPSCLDDEAVTGEEPVDYEHFYKVDYDLDAQGFLTFSTGINYKFTDGELPRFEDFVDQCLLEVTSVS